MHAIGSEPNRRSAILPCADFNGSFEPEDATSRGLFCTCAKVPCLSSFACLLGPFKHSPTHPALVDLLPYVSGRASVTVTFSPCFGSRSLLGLDVAFWSAHGPSVPVLSCFLMPSRCMISVDASDQPGSKGRRALTALVISCSFSSRPLPGRRPPAGSTPTPTHQRHTAHRSLVRLSHLFE